MLSGAEADVRGFAPWHFEQYEHEAVMIPGGCPHQVRNLRACIKVAVDFVSPEALGQTFKMADMLSQCHMKQVAKLAPLPPPPLPPPALLPASIATEEAPEVKQDAEIAIEVEGVAFVDPVVAAAGVPILSDLIAPPDAAAPEESMYQDKLQGRLIMLSAAVHLYKELHPEFLGNEGEAKSKKARKMTDGKKSIPKAAGASKVSLEADATAMEPAAEPIKKKARVEMDPAHMEEPAAAAAPVDDLAPAAAPKTTVKKKGKKSTPHQAT